MENLSTEFFLSLQLYSVTYLIVVCLVAPSTTTTSERNSSGASLCRFRLHHAVLQVWLVAEGSAVPLSFVPVPLKLSQHSLSTCADDDDGQRGQQLLGHHQHGISGQQQQQRRRDGQWTRKITIGYEDLHRRRRRF